MPSPTHRHLRRLDSVWIENPVYFLTLCAAGRRPALANDAAVAILRVEFGAAPKRYGWSVGRFVAMPDHLHFFCVNNEAPSASSLSRFMAGFKQWTAKGILRETGLAQPFWQKEFFDHVLRTDESYESKWLYVRENPVRAGLVSTADDWPYAGEITPIVR
jgi:putative transposase